MGKSIALFGTSADPPTIGHEKILEELSKIYAHTICYVSNNPKKKHKEDIAIRSQLLKTLIEDLDCLLYTSPSPRDRQKSRMPSSA